MNLNVLLAVLEHKAIITSEEAEKLAERLQMGIQSVSYKDALADVKKLLKSK
jgi:hypothetical protein